MTLAATDRYRLAVRELRLAAGLAGPARGRAGPGPDAGRRGPDHDGGAG